MVTKIGNLISQKTNEESTSVDNFSKHFSTKVESIQSSQSNGTMNFPDADEKPAFLALGKPLFA